VRSTEYSLVQLLSEYSSQGNRSPKRISTPTTTVALLRSRNLDVMRTFQG